MCKRISALLLALVMVFSLTLCVSAAESNASLSIAAQRYGDKGVVIVDLAGGQGITNGKIHVTYDSALVTLLSVRVMTECGAASVNKETDGVVSLAWVGSNLKAKESLLELTFQVDAPGDVAITAGAEDAYAGQTMVELAPCTASMLYEPFVDIDNHWAREEILKAYHGGLFTGVTTTTFVPEGTMTRAMFVTVLHRMAGMPAAAAEAGFADVDPQKYYAGAVDWAVEAGVTNGVGDGKFAPNQAIARQEMATMLHRYATATGLDISDGAELGDFTDAANVSSWALEAMCWAVAEGIIEGYPNGRLMPRTNATRAQAAVILCRYLGY